MRALIQRVNAASVVIDGRETAKIEEGFLILLGVGADDDEASASKLWRKISKLRVFQDAAGKTNLSLEDVGGNILIVSQFTLWADCRKGNRPSFIRAASAEKGEALYRYFLEMASIEYPRLAQGVFGAEMKIQLVNDGPFTIWLDSDEL